MDSQNPISTLLRTARESARLSVSELSKITSIRTHVINAIDEGRFADLPQVYMRSFIRSYARTVGINEQEMELLMNQHLSELAKKPTSQPINPPKNIPSPKYQQPNNSKPSVPIQNRTVTHIGKSSVSNRVKWFLGILGVALASVAGYFMYIKQPDNPNAITPGSLPPSVVGAKDSSGNNSSGNNGGLLTYFGIDTPSSADSIVLEANATDTSWISITIDGKRNEQITLMPQTSKRWSAFDKLVLSIGNAGGVTLVRNGTALPVLGKRGETVRMVRVTRTEFVTSSTPNKPKVDTTRKKPATTLQQPKPNLPTKSNQNVIATKPSATQPVKEIPRVVTSQKQLPTVTKPPVTTPKPNSTIIAKPNTTVSNKPIGTANPAVTKPNIQVTTKPPVTIPTTVLPKPKPTAITKDAADAKKRRDDLLRRARQLEVTTVPPKTVTPSEDKKPK